MRRYKSESSVINSRKIPHQFISRRPIKRNISDDKDLEANIICINSQNDDDSNENNEKDTKTNVDTNTNNSIDLDLEIVEDNEDNIESKINETNHSIPQNTLNLKKHFEQEISHLITEAIKQAKDELIVENKQIYHRSNSENNGTNNGYKKDIEEKKDELVEDESPKYKNGSLESKSLLPIQLKNNISQYFEPLDSSWRDQIVKQTTNTLSTNPFRDDDKNKGKRNFNEESIPLEEEEFNFIPLTKKIKSSSSYINNNGLYNQNQIQSSPIKRPINEYEDDIGYDNIHQEVVEDKVINSKSIENYISKLELEIERLKRKELSLEKSKLFLQSELFNLKNEINKRGKFCNKCYKLMN